VHLKNRNRNINLYHIYCKIRGSVLTSFSSSFELQDRQILRCSGSLGVECLPVSILRLWLPALSSATARQCFWFVISSSELEVVTSLLKVESSSYLLAVTKMPVNLTRRCWDYSIIGWTKFSWTVATLMFDNVVLKCSKISERLLAVKKVGLPFDGPWSCSITALISPQQKKVKISNSSSFLDLAG